MLDCLDSDKWHVGDLEEKKGDWFAEKNTEDDDDRFLEVVTGKDPNLELSSPSSIFTNFSAIQRYQILCMHSSYEELLWNKKKYGFSKSGIFPIW